MPSSMASYTFTRRTWATKELLIAWTILYFSVSISYRARFSYAFSDFNCVTVIFR